MIPAIGNKNSKEIFEQNTDLDFRAFDINNEVIGCTVYDIEKQMLQDALTKLSKREKQIMELRFGIGNSKEMTQKEVADLLGISQSYISRLEKKIIARLRNLIGDKI